MNKIKIKILESATAKGCKHDLLTCSGCGSVITMREPKKFNVKRFITLSVKLRDKLSNEFVEEKLPTSAVIIEKTDKMTAQLFKEQMPETL